MYKLKGHLEKSLVHDIVEPSELWHRRLGMCITEYYLLQAKLSKVFQKSKQNMMEFAKDVRKEIIQRRHFQAMKAKQRKS